MNPRSFSSPRILLTPFKMAEASQGSNSFALKTRGFSPTHRHCEQSEAISGLPRRSLKLSPRNDGFSLIELSIVLVILGLLTGGILTGQNLIRAANLKTILTDKQRFVNAVDLYREQFLELPGDHSTATTMWGRADDGTFSGNCADPENNAGTGTQTCNGNGNGKIREGNGSVQFHEVFRVWEHLRNAGLIEGDFSGVKSDSNHAAATPGVNLPRSALGSTVGMAILHNEVLSGAPFLFDAPQGHVVHLAGFLNNTFINAPVLTPEEAWSIDTKGDDGLPGFGFIRSTKFTHTLAPNCTTSDVANTAEYSLTRKETLCVLQFRLDF